MVREPSLSFPTSKKLGGGNLLGSLSDVGWRLSVGMTRDALQALRLGVVAAHSTHVAQTF